VFLRTDEILDDL
jgi:hypothetical protein